MLPDWSVGREATHSEMRCISGGYMYIVTGLEWTEND